MPELTQAESPFRDCSAEHVFLEVSKQLATDEMRSLWSRVADELRRSGPGAVATYLDSEFTQLQQDFEQEVQRVALRAD